MKTSNEIREIFVNYMKGNGHKIIPGVSLLPVNDPSLLFVNSGMFPLVPYLMGEQHPQGACLADFQRCIRTQDIEEVGDHRHLTLFEMMGNWSLGDYFKETQLTQVMELYVDKFGLDIANIYTTVFKGDNLIPKDDESIEILKTIFKHYGIDAEYTEDPFKVGTSNFKIFGLGREDNWWSRGALAPNELGGPDSEIFYDIGVTTNLNHTGPVAINDDSGRYIEIGNSVFMQFKLNKKLKWEALSVKNVDFGGGFERIVPIIQKKIDPYDTDLFQPIIHKIEDLSGKVWKDEKIDEIEIREIQNVKFRIISDHIRAAVFIIADGILPSNKEQGYILRRLLRRMIRKAMQLGITDNFTRKLAEVVIQSYSKPYPHLLQQNHTILNAVEEEEIQFRKTILKGIKEFEKVTAMGVNFTGAEAFRLYETYGFPIEMILEELENDMNDIGDFSEQDELKLIEEFKVAQNEHATKSRLSSKKKFKGGLADVSDKTTRLHTAHHLLLAALQEVLGPHVHQKGSNITSERLRMDFSHSMKLTNNEIHKIEEIVNSKINNNFIVEKRTMPRAKAEKLGAEMEFGKKYGDLVNVYMIKDPESDEIFSKEFCGGPHVTNTKELSKSGAFKIIKEQSSGSGIRRIKAVLE